MKTQLSLLRIKVSVVCVAFFCLVLLLEVRKEFKNKIHICGIFSSHLKELSGQPKKSYFLKKKKVHKQLTSRFLTENRVEQEILDKRQRSENIQRSDK